MERNKSSRRVREGEIVLLCMYNTISTATMYQTYSYYMHAGFHTEGEKGDSPKEKHCCKKKKPLEVKYISKFPGGAHQDPWLSKRA